MSAMRLESIELFGRSLTIINISFLSRKKDLCFARPVAFEGATITPRNFLRVSRVQGFSLSLSLYIYFSVGTRFLCKSRRLSKHANAWKNISQIEGNVPLSQASRESLVFGFLLILIHLMISRISQILRMSSLRILFHRV